MFKYQCPPKDLSMKTKVVQSCLVVALLTVWLYMGCDSPVQPSTQAPKVIETKGALAMAVDAATVPQEVRLIVATLERSGFIPLTDSLTIDPTTPDSTILSISNIPAGIWDLTVRAYDAEGYERYSGTAQVEIKSNQTTGVAVVMRLSTGGAGTLVISLLWESPMESRWIMDAANPLLGQSQSGWDAGYVYVSEPSVLFRREGFQMWYTTGVGAVQSIAYATSLDGVQWTKRGIVIGQDSLDNNRAFGASSPSVLYVGMEYHMWFNGKIASNIPHGGIRHATSSDGQTWRVDPSLVIPLEAPATGIFGANVIRTDSAFRLYYTVETTDRGVKSYAVHLAESFDGTNWERRGIVFRAQPSFAWQQGDVYTPCVIHRRGQYVMFYTSGNTSLGASIGKAVSTDGIHWTSTSTQPEISPQQAAPWNVNSVGYPSVVDVNGELWMWFAGLSTTMNRWEIGLARYQ